MSPKHFIALDLEFNQPSGKIIQVGVCLGHPLQAEEEFVVRKWYVDPGEPVADAIVALTGIDDAAIRDNAVPAAQIAEELGALLRAQDTFVNPITWGGGDSAALLTFFREQGAHFPHFGRRWFDVKTVYAHMQLCEGRGAAGGLRSAMGRYKLQFTGTAHRADVDAFNTLRFFFHLQARQRAMEGLLQLARVI